MDSVKKGFVKRAIFGVAADADGKELLEEVGAPDGMAQVAHFGFGVCRPASIRPLLHRMHAVRLQL